MTQAEHLAHDALEACGPDLTRQQFSTFAWCAADLEVAGWNAYRRIVGNRH